MSDLGDQDLIGKMGFISIPISVDKPGEVIIQVRGGSEAFTAISDEPIPKHSQVVVVDKLSARTVMVTKF